MPHYIALRTVGDITVDQAMSAGFRARQCSAAMGEVRWLGSTWDRERGEVTCLYEAPSAQLVREHSEAALLPCSEVRQVEMVDPGAYVQGENHQAAGG